MKAKFKYKPPKGKYGNLQNWIRCKNSIEEVCKENKRNFVEYYFIPFYRGGVMKAELISERGIENIAYLSSNSAEIDTSEIRKKLKKRLGLEI